MNSEYAKTERLESLDQEGETKKEEQRGFPEVELEEKRGGN